MNYMIKKSKTRGAQPESPVPKKRTLFYAKCYKNEDKKRKLDTLKKLSKLQHPGNNPGKNKDLELTVRGQKSPHFLFDDFSVFKVEFTSKNFCYELIISNLVTGSPYIIS